MRDFLRRTVRRSSGISVVVALVGLCAGVRAARAQDSTLRLAALYAEVRRENPKVVAAGALTRAAEARVPGVTRPPDPQLQLGFMNYAVPSFTPMPILGMTQLQLMQMVPLGGKLGLSGRVARAQASATGERATDIAWEIRNEAAMAFYDLYAADRQLEVARETLVLLQNVATTTESMYRVGEARQADVLRAQVEIARMAEDTLRMQAMRQTMVARINALRDRADSAEVATPALPRFPALVPAVAWLDSVAADGRPMIRAGLEDVRAADASRTLARREIIPDLQVGVQYAQQGPDKMASLMLGASLPIFARDRQLQMRNEATAMKAMADADLVAMRADTRGRIGEAYANLLRARNLGRLYRNTILPQADATVTSAMSAYRAGAVDFMTLLDDEMSANGYRQQLATLEADEGKAWAELEMLVGRELFDPSAIAMIAGDADKSQRGAP